jgi:hypothetical protein
MSLSHGLGTCGNVPRPDTSPDESTGGTTNATSSVGKVFPSSAEFLSREQHKDQLRFDVDPLFPVR